MKTKILSLLLLLGVSFTAANATSPCTEIHVIPVQSTLQSCDGQSTQTVEVVIHNPEYCYSTITDITLSDTANFELNTSYGEVPCNSDTFSMRGYQFCTVGVTFKPTTSSGTFETDISVGSLAAPLTSATIDGEIVNSTSTCTCGNNGHHGKRCGSKGHHGSKCSKGNHGSKCGHKSNSCDNDNKCGSKGHHGSKCSKGNHGSKCGHKARKHNHSGNTCSTTCSIEPVKTLADASATNYLAGLNLTNPLGTSTISIVNGEVVFNNYNEQNDGLATFALDNTVNFVSMLTFTATIDNGLFMPILSGDDGVYLTNDVRTTNKYGFIFPDTFALDTLEFTTWGVSFTGTISGLSLTEITNENILEKE